MILTSTMEYKTDHVVLIEQRDCMVRFRSSMWQYTMYTSNVGRIILLFNGRLTLTRFDVFPSDASLHRIAERRVFARPWLVRLSHPPPPPSMVPSVRFYHFVRYPHSACLSPSTPLPSPTRSSSSAPLSGVLPFASVYPSVLAPLSPPYRPTKIFARRLRSCLRWCVVV